MKGIEKWESEIRLGPFKKQNTWEVQVSDQVLEKLPPYMPSIFSFFHSLKHFPRLNISRKAHTDCSIFLNLIEEGLYYQSGPEVDVGYSLLQLYSSILRSLQIKLHSCNQKRVGKENKFTTLAGRQN